MIDPMNTNDLTSPDGLESPQEPTKEQIDRLNAIKAQEALIKPEATFAPIVRSETEKYSSKDSTPFFTDGLGNNTLEVVKGLGDGVVEFVRDTYDVVDMVAGDSLPDWDRSNPWIKLDSGLGNTVKELTSFGLSFVPVGRAVGLVGKGAKALGLGAKAGLIGKAAKAIGSPIGQSIIKGGLADFYVSNDGAGLSKIIEGTALANPVTAYLSGEDSDSKFEKRLKATIEGIPLGLVADGVMSLFKSSAVEATLAATKKTKAFRDAIKEGKGEEEALEIASKTANEHLDRALEFERRAKDIPQINAYRDTAIGDEGIITREPIKKLPVDEEGGMGQIEVDAMFNAEQAASKELVRLTDNRDLSNALLKEMGFNDVSSPVDYALKSNEILSAGGKLSPLLISMKLDTELATRIPQLNMNKFIGIDSWSNGFKAIKYEVSKYVDHIVEPIGKTASEIKELDPEGQYVSGLIENYLESFAKGAGATNEQAARLLMESTPKLPPDYADKLAGLKLELKNAANEETKAAIEDSIKKQYAIGNKTISTQKNILATLVTADLMQTKLSQRIVSLFDSIDLSKATVESKTQIMRSIEEFAEFNARMLDGTLQAADKGRLYLRKDKTLIGKLTKKDSIGDLQDRVGNYQTSARKVLQTELDKANSDLLALEKEFEQLHDRTDLPDDKAFRDIEAPLASAIEEANDKVIRLQGNLDILNKPEEILNEYGSFDNKTLDRIIRDRRVSEEEIAAIARAKEVNPYVTKIEGLNDELTKLELQTLGTEKELDELLGQGFDVDQELVEDLKFVLKDLEVRKTNINAKLQAVNYDSLDFQLKLSLDNLENQIESISKASGIAPKHLIDQKNGIAELIKQGRVNASKLGRVLRVSKSEFKTTQDADLSIKINNWIKLAKAEVDLALDKNVNRNLPDLVSQYKLSGIDEKEIDRRLNTIKAQYSTIIDSKGMDEVDKIKAVKALLGNIQGTGYFRRIVERMNSIGVSGMLGNIDTLTNISLNNVAAAVSDSIFTAIGSLPASVFGKTMQPIKYAIGNTFGTFHALGTPDLWLATLHGLKTGKSKLLSEAVGNPWAKVDTSEVLDSLGRQRSSIGRPLETSLTVIDTVSGLGGFTMKLVGAIDEFFKQLSWRREMFGHVYAKRMSEGYAFRESLNQANDSLKRTIIDGEALNYKSLYKQGKAFAEESWTKAGLPRDEKAIEIAAQRFVSDNLPVAEEAFLIESSQKAIQNARLATASQDPGKVNRMIQDVSYKLPFLRTVMPFRNGPMNAFANAWDFTTAPLQAVYAGGREALDMGKKIANGIATWHKDSKVKADLLGPTWREMINTEGNRTLRELYSKSPELKAKAIGRIVTASALGYYVLTHAANAYTGKEGTFIVGTGPTDPEQLRTMEARGLKPYSIGYRDAEGNITSTPYTTVEPLGQLMTLVADVMALQYVKNDAESEAYSQGLWYALINMVEKSVVGNIKDVTGVVSDRDTNAKNFVRGLVRRLVPFGGQVNKLKASLGESDMEPRSNYGDLITDDGGSNYMGSLVKSLSERLPWGSLGPKYDPFGNPIKSKAGDKTNDPAFLFYYRAILGIDSMEQGADPVLDELIKQNISLGLEKKPRGKKVNLLDPKFNSPDGKTAFDQWNELLSKHKTSNNLSLKDEIKRTISDPSYKALDDLPEGQKIQKERIRKTYNPAKDSAWNKLVQQNPALQQYLSGN